MTTGEHDFQEIINKSYENLDSTPEWSSMLSEIVAFCSAEMGLLLGGDAEKFDGPIKHVVGVGKDYIHDYANGYVKKDPRVPYLKMNIGKAYRYDDYTGVEVMERSAFVNEFLEPRGFRWGMGGCFTKINNSYGFIGFHRARRNGPFSNEEVERLQRFVPHLRRAFALYAKVDRHRVMAQTYEGLLSILQTPVLLLTREGRVVVANPAAERILRRNDGLSVCMGHLSAMASDDRKQLAMALQNTAQAISGAAALSSRGTSLIQRRDGSSSYQLGICPLPRAHGLTGLDPHAELAVFIVDPENRIKADLPAYQRCFGLTPAEARLAAYLVEGMSLVEVARKHRLSITTVRSQLQGLFVKTETHRQVDLIRVLQSRNLPEVSNPAAFEGQ